MTNMWVENSTDNGMITYDFCYHVFVNYDDIIKQTKEKKLIAVFFKFPTIVDDEAHLTLVVDGRHKKIKTLELGKDILHCLYMYLLEHNEEHLNYLERLK